MLGRLTVVGLIVLVGSASMANESARNDKAAARAAYVEGTRHYDLGEYADALAAFKHAYMNYEDPAFLFNIAQCNRQLGNKTEAVKFYKTFLRKIPNAPNRAEVERLVANLETSIAAEKVQKSEPPTGTLSPAKAADKPNTTVTPTENDSSVARSVTPGKTPVYKKWWLWTIVAVAVAGAGVGLGVGLTQTSVSYPSAMTTGGSFRF